MKTKNVTLLTAASLALVVLATGCSSVMCGKTQTIAIVTKPPGAEVKVFDRFEDVIFRGETPCKVTLARGYEDRSAGHYRVTITKDGFELIEHELVGLVNRAYTVNIMNAGIGYAVDPMTGAMWTLVPMDINEVLTPVAEPMCTAAK